MSSLKHPNIGIGMTISPETVESKARRLSNVVNGILRREASEERVTEEPPDMSSQLSDVINVISPKEINNESSHSVLEQVIPVQTIEILVDPSAITRESMDEDMDEGQLENEGQPTEESNDVTNGINPSTRTESNPEPQSDMITDGNEASAIVNPTATRTGVDGKESEEEMSTSIPNRILPYQSEGRSRRTKLHPVKIPSIPPPPATPTVSFSAHPAPAKSSLLPQTHHMLKPNTTTRPNINIKPFACTFPSCNKAFHWMNSLQIHMLTHSDKTERKFACEVEDCNQRFYWASKLKVHMLTHMDKDVRPFACEVCGKSFKQKSYLKKHMQKHSQEKMGLFTCLVPDCNKQFPWKENLQVHMLSHSGKDDRKYVCTVCDKTFFWQSKLQVHLLSHSDKSVKSFVCDVCDRRFVHSSYLKKHKLLHSDKKIRKRYTCVVCDMEYTLESALDEHMITHGFSV